VREIRLQTNRIADYVRGSDRYSPSVGESTQLGIVRDGVVTAGVVCFAT